MVSEPSACRPTVLDAWSILNRFPTTLSWRENRKRVWVDWMDWIGLAQVNPGRGIVTGLGLVRYAWRCLLYYGTVVRSNMVEHWDQPCSTQANAIHPRPHLYILACPWKQGAIASRPDETRELRSRRTLVEATTQITLEHGSK